MKIAVGILLTIVMALAWRLNAEMELNRQQQAHVAELTSKLNDKIAHENIKLQAMCTQQAGAMFLQFGFKNNTSDSYQSHYNSKLNKCFMTIYFLAGEFTNEALFDVFEQRIYASYMRTQDMVKKDWDVPPTYCRSTPDAASESSCKSLDEYKAFVARYME